MTAPVRIGPYVIERRLGGGGMAEVFLASVVGEAGFSRPVAIKRVLPGFGDRPEFAALFISEAKLSARLRHPNIVSVLDFQRDPEHGLFLVMELVEGKDLDQLLNTGLLPLSLAITIAAEMLRGLGYAHHPPRREDGILGLVHRDVSPQNVLLSWEGEVKVSDFGIAKSREAAQAAASVMTGKLAPALPTTPPKLPSAPLVPSAVPPALPSSPAADAQDPVLRVARPTSPEPSLATKAPAGPHVPRRPAKKPQPTGFVEIKLAPATEGPSP
jgi:serine/threonine protein kinase